MLMLLVMLVHLYHPVNNYVPSVVGTLFSFVCHCVKLPRTFASVDLSFKGLGLFVTQVRLSDSEVAGILQRSRGHPYPGEQLNPEAKPAAIGQEACFLECCCLLLRLSCLP